MHMSHQYMCFLLWAVPFQTDLEVVNLQPRIIPLLPGAVIIKCKSAHRQPSVSHDTSPFTDNQGSDFCGKEGGSSGPGIFKFMRHSGGLNNPS